MHNRLKDAKKESHHSSVKVDATSHTKPWCDLLLVQLLPHTLFVDGFHIEELKRFGGNGKFCVLIFPPSNQFLIYKTEILGMHDTSFACYCAHLPCFGFLRRVRLLYFWNSVHISITHMLFPPLSSVVHVPESPCKYIYIHIQTQYCSPTWISKCRQRRRKRANFWQSPGYTLKLRLGYRRHVPEYMIMYIYIYIYMYTHTQIHTYISVHLCSQTHS